MMGSVAKVDENSFGMTDVEITVWLGRKTSPHFAVSRCKVSFPKGKAGLGIFAGFVERSEKTFFKNRLPGNDRYGF